MGTNSNGGISVEIGRTYELDITKYGPGFKPYGIFDNTPVIIGDSRDKSKNEDLYINQPGDRVTVRVNDIVGECAFASVEEHCGTFINKDDRGTVTLTEQSNNDARDSISAPEQGDGYCGVFTIVKSVKPEHPGIENKKRDCYVRIGALKEGKERRHFVISYVVNTREERRLSKEIYVSSWPPENMELPEGYSQVNGRVPRPEYLHEMKIGVPRGPVAMLYLGDGMRKRMTPARGEDVDMTGMNLSDAVDQFYRRNGHEIFRLCLATPDSVHLMRQAIENSVFSLVVEDLPAIHIKSNES